MRQAALHTIRARGRRGERSRAARWSVGPRESMNNVTRTDSRSLRVTFAMPHMLNVTRAESASALGTLFRWRAGCRPR